MSAPLGPILTSSVKIKQKSISAFLGSERCLATGCFISHLLMQLLCLVILSFSEHSASPISD